MKVREVLLIAVTATALISGCREAQLYPGTDTEEFINGIGFPVAEYGPKQSDPGSIFFIQNVKEDLPDTLEYPDVGNRTTISVTPDVGTYIPALTWESSSDSSTAIDEDNDGVTDLYNLRGNVFVETGEYSESESRYLGMPLRLTGAQLTLTVDGILEGTAELPDFSQIGGYFSDINWSAINPATVVTKTGAEIKTLLTEQGSELTMPLQNDRTYFLFFFNGDFTAVFGGGLGIGLPSIPDMPSASLAFVLDSHDPMFYITYATELGFLEGLKDDEKDKKDDGTKSDTKKKQNMGVKGFLAMDEFPIKGIGFSYNGWIPIEREYTCPFSDDTDGNTLYIDDDPAQPNIYEGDPREMPSGNTLYVPLFATVCRCTDFEGKSRIVVGYPADESLYETIETLVSDPIPRLPLFDRTQYSNVFVTGEVPLNSVGIPIKLTEAAFLFDPNDEFIEIVSLGYRDIPFRLVSNGELNFEPGFIKKEQFLKMPDNLGGATAMIEHTASTNLVLFSFSGSAADLTVSDFIDFSKIGGKPDMSIGDKVLGDGVITSLVGDEAPTGFLNDVDMDWLDTLVMPGSIDFDFAGYLSLPPGPFECLYAVSSRFRLDPFALINPGSGSSVEADVSELQGALLCGYPYGVFMSGFMDYSLPSCGISTSGDSLLTAWIVALDNWGFHFETDIEMELFGGLGTIDLSNAYIDLTNDGFGVGGSFVFDTPLPNTGASVVVEGAIDFNEPDFYLDGIGEVTLLGFDIINAHLGVGYRTGIDIAGSLTVPYFSTVEMAGSYYPPTNDFSLSGAAEVSLFSADDDGLPTIDLASAKVILSNQGVAVGGSLGVPGLGSVEVDGKLESNGNFLLSGRGNLAIGDIDLLGAEVAFYNEGGNAGMEIDGQLVIPELFTARVRGEIDLDEGTMSLAGMAALDIPGTDLTIADARIEFTADVLDGDNLVDLQLKVSASVSVYDYLNAKIQTIDPNHITLEVGAGGVTVQGDVMGSCELITPTLVIGFGAFGLDFLEFSVWGEVAVQITLHIDTEDLSRNGFGLGATAGVHFTYPWADVTMEVYYLDVGLFDIPIYYPVFSWYDEEGSIEVSGKIKITAGGISFAVDLPVVGVIKFSF